MAEYTNREVFASTEREVMLFCIFFISVSYEMSCGQLNSESEFNKHMLFQQYINKVNLSHNRYTHTGFSYFRRKTFVIFYAENSRTNRFLKTFT